jgi:G2/mitotic-specific cyclin 3/4
MSATGNFNMAAKRTALGDRNVASRDSSDALHTGKSGTTYNYNTSSTMVASKAQENRMQANPKVKAKDAPGAFHQPAQRPITKSLVPSASMGQLRPGASEAYVPRKPHGKLSSLVYRDPRQEEARPAPAEPTDAVPVHLPAALPQAVRVRPSITHRDTYTQQQQRPAKAIDSRLPTALQPERVQLLEQPPSHQPISTKAQVHEQTHSTTFPSLIRLAEISPCLSPHTDDDDDATEPLYVDAVEDYAQQNWELLTDDLADHTDAPQPHRVATHSLPEPHIAEPIHPSQRSSPQPTTDPINYNNPSPPHPVTESLYPAYLSDCDEDEDHGYDDKGYTTAHSYPSHGDNTTGGVTTVMFPPKVTKKGQAEIEAAMQIVESRRTAEEIQEDAWDISMVAEYGEEIFQYMREQEVRLKKKPRIRGLLD